MGRAARTWRPIAAVLLAATVTMATAPATAAEAVVTLEEPRPYGYVLGDLIERKADIALPSDHELARDTLPRRGRIDAWLELRRIELAPRPGGVRLLLTYQVINAPQKVTTVELPALSLALRDRNRPDAAPVPLAVEDWPLTLAPLTPEFVLSRAGLPDLQPDIAPQRAAVAPHLERIALWSVLLMLAAYALATRRYPQLAFWRRDAPFRRALPDLQALARRPADGAARRHAFERLHQAFNATAGRAVFAERLEPLYVARPSLQAAAAEIDAFYAASRRSFFAGAPAAPDEAPGPSSVAELLALCRRLAQLEAGA